MLSESFIYIYYKNSMPDDITKMAAATAQDDKFYSPDLNAQVIGENNGNDADLGDTSAEDDPVTSNDMNLSDLDADMEGGGDDGESYDEESVPAGEDNTVSED